MDFIELTVGNAALYSESVNRDVAENLRRSGYFGAAAVDDGHPLAAMIWHITAGNNNRDYTASEIVWMNVTDEGDASKELLEYYNRCIEEAGVKWSSFVLDRVLFKKSIKVLEDAGFTLCEREGTDLFTSVGALISRPFARIKGSDDNIYETGTLKKRAFNEAIRECLSKARRKFPEDMANLGKEWFEPELSCYCENNCALNGMLLVHKLPSRALRVELLAYWGSAGEAEVAQMMKHAIINAFELYEADTPVILPRSDKASLRLASYVLPDAKGRPSIYGKRQEMQRDR